MFNVAALFDQTNGASRITFYLFHVTRPTLKKLRVGHPPCFITFCQAVSELVGADEMAATILLVARFSGFIAERLFFAVADGAEAIGRDTQRD